VARRQMSYKWGHLPGCSKLHAKARRATYLSVQRRKLQQGRHWLQCLVPSELYFLSDLPGGLMSTINAATICSAAAKANGTT
jgi:hypothetical protein